MEINKFIEELQKINGYSAEINIETLPYNVLVIIYDDTIQEPDNIVTIFDVDEPEEDLLKRIIETLKTKNK